MMLPPWVRSVLAKLRVKPQRKWPFYFAHPTISFQASRHRCRASQADHDAAVIDPPELSSQLGRLWKGESGSHKWSHYFPVYEAALGKYVGGPVKLLEIGVQMGGSLRMWRRYFGDQSVVVGIDIDPRCAEHDDPANGVNVRIGSQADPAFLNASPPSSGPLTRSSMTAAILHRNRDQLQPSVQPRAQASADLSHRGYPCALLAKLPRCQVWVGGVHRRTDRSHARSLLGNAGSSKFLHGSAAQVKKIVVPAITAMIRHIEISDRC